MSEILKSYSNEGKDYRFNIFYYRGKDKRAAGENEIDLIIEEDGILYPVEIKMSGNPKADMGAANQVLDKIPDRKRGMGVILCFVDRKLYLRENLIALPIEYIYSGKSWRFPEAGRRTSLVTELLWSMTISLFYG